MHSDQITALTCVAYETKASVSREGLRVYTCVRTQQCKCTAGPSPQSSCSQRRGREPVNWATRGRRVCLSLPEQGRACEVQLEPGLFIPSTHFLSTLVVRRKGPAAWELSCLTRRVTPGDAVQTVALRERRDFLSQ